MGHVEGGHCKPPNPPDTPQDLTDAAKRSGISYPKINLWSHSEYAVQSGRTHPRAGRTYSLLTTDNNHHEIKNSNVLFPKHTLRRDPALICDVSL